MVRLAFFALASLLAVASATPHKRTVAQVEADLSDLAQQVSDLNTAINNFPNSGGGLIGALRIDAAAGDLDDAVVAATSDVNNTPTPSAADAAVIVAQVAGFEPTIVQALQRIITKKPSFTSLGLLGVAHNTLSTLNTDTRAFEAALIAKTPTSPPALLSSASSLTSAINSALSAALSAYP